ncbi:MAG: hypothetical protein HGA74_15685, partial [Deltaproteobacteria bacterium]|nr:hypothetical protein [Deltaproteobacteria bacterium]
MRHPQTHSLSLNTALVVCLVLLWSLSSFASDKAVKSDSNKDGKIDQIAHFDDRGKLVKLELDSNGDEVMDRFQYYKEEQVVRVEADRNFDGKIDSWDYFESGKRVKHEQ